MRIRYNGRELELIEPARLSDVAIAGANCVALVNGRIVARESWGLTPISEGDAVELVTMVNGG